MNKFWRIFIALLVIIAVARGMTLWLKVNQASRENPSRLQSHEPRPPREPSPPPAPTGSIQYGDITLTPEILATMENTARSPELQALRHAVDECLGRRPVDPDDPRCEPGMLNEAGPALNDRFCLLSGERGDFGGWVYLVITNTPPHQLLVLWGFVYDQAELPVLRGTWLAGFSPERAAKIVRYFGAMCVQHPSVQF